MSKNPKKKMKIVNIDGENHQIFWTTWGILVKFSGNVWIMIILKLKKKTGPHPLSLKHTFLKKPDGECQADRLLTHVQPFKD